MITPVPCLKDNYAYIVTCDATKQTAIVDPSEAAPVLEAVKRLGVKPSAIWNTHHHWDHVGGNEELCAALGITDVYGHASDKGRIANQSKFVEENDTFALGDLAVRILHIPGHTTGAVAYVVAGSAKRDGTNGEVAEDAVFTGDTLFIAGCGRLFEGTPAMMFDSFEKLAALRDATRVYCGHEYTKANLVFARHVEPDNADVKDYASKLAVPSVPSTIGLEKRINPFVRARTVEEFASRRSAKDDFKG
ncbi:MAG TPA: hydroxyacylglutathione hydrolase [Polyangiaceae bacterium]|nr:hydroxyacylglutathione hydrolase [Polyangiaceae bacterium]